MSAFLIGAGMLILLTVLLGLLRILRGPGDAERITAVNLLGTGGVAALLLLGSAVDLAAATDLALVLVLLAAFAGVAFVAGLGAGRGAELHDGAEDLQTPGQKATSAEPTPGPGRAGD
ncbi:MAG: sodium:proton antiporter [Thiohalocapsa sp.]|jgi:multicomponent Na+:H+ antiporter subunit F